MKIKRLKTPVRNAVVSAMSTKIKTYEQRYGYEMSESCKISALSYLLLKQPYNPILWVLYSLNRFLHGCKPADFGKKEILIRDYYRCDDHWLEASFDDIHDIIAIDDVGNPRTALATLWAPTIQDVTIKPFDDLKTLYHIPVEWIPHIATREHSFVLVHFKFVVKFWFVQQRKFNHNICLMRLISMLVVDRVVTIVKLWLR